MLKIKHLNELKVNIREIREIELNGHEIEGIEDNLFHGAVLLSKLNLSCNNLKAISKKIFNCGECNCLAKLDQLNLCRNKIVQIEEQSLLTDSISCIFARRTRLEIWNIALSTSFLFVCACIHDACLVHEELRWGGSSLDCCLLVSSHFYWLSKSSHQKK